MMSARQGFKAAGRLLAAAAVAVLIAACAAADKPSSMAAAPSSTGSTSAASGGSMAGMNMGSSSKPSGYITGGSGESFYGIRPIPTQTLASASWQGMDITARVMTAVPFVIYNGTSMQEVKPGKNTSFHLMVMLTDAHTGVAIPYSTVWATIMKDGKVVYDERQWPMISRYMGPHYGNDVALPGGGTYHLSLLVSPPVSARHLEYQNVWLTPHRVNLVFHWKPAP